MVHFSQIDLDVLTHSMQFMRLSYWSRKHIDFTIFLYYAPMADEGFTMHQKESISIIKV